MATHVPGIWGIDLGQCALKALRLDNVGGEVTATAFDYIEHPKILSQPDADPDELTREALQQFLARNSIKGDMVVISVPGQSGLARFVKLPPVEEKKIADIVKFEAKQQIPFPLEEVVWDFQKIGQGVVTDGFAMETEIGLFAMKKDMVYRSIQQFKDVNVEIHVIQMAPLALCNYVAYDLLHKDGMGGGEPDEAAEKKACVVALDIGTDNSNLIITDGEKIIWQRPIPLGGNHFTRALTKDMKLTFAKAEHLKRNAVKSPDLKKILASLKAVLNDFVGEVQRSLGYFTNTHRDATIQYMIGLGNAFRLPGLQKYLQEKLQLEVRKLTKLERVHGEEVIAAPTFSENLMSFAVACGLALQGMKVSRIQTNLLPYEIRVERIVRGKKPWAVAGAAALLLAVAGLAFGYSVERKGVVNAEITAELAKAKSVVDKINKLNADYKAETDRKEEALKSLRRIGAGVEERFNWQLLYQYVNMALPRHNGDKLSVDTQRHVNAKNVYLTPEALKAFAMLEEKRFGKSSGGDAKKVAADDEFIKKHLIQINVEGISALYSDDLPVYFKTVYQFSDLLLAMSSEERKLVKKFATADEAASAEFKAKLPVKGWVVEIRGYTYNKGTGQFVEDTIVENLARPDRVGNQLSPEMTKLIKDRISYMMLFKNDTVPDPQPGQFKFIGKSALKALITGPGNVGGGPGGNKVPAPPSGPDLRGPGAVDTTPNRDAWRPIGEIASTSFGDILGAAGFGPNKMVQPVVPMAVVPGKEAAPPTVDRTPRTEFVVLFIWQEPLPVDADAAKKD
jgi:type IV pilus assembly protein PilM